MDSASLAARIDAIDRAANSGRGAVSVAEAATLDDDVAQVLAVLRSPDGWELDDDGVLFVKHVDPDAAPMSSAIREAIDDTPNMIFRSYDDHYTAFSVSAYLATSDPFVEELARRQRARDDLLLSTLPAVLDAFVERLLVDLREWSANDRTFREWFGRAHWVTRDADGEPLSTRMWNDHVRGELATRLARHFHPEHFTVIVERGCSSVVVKRRK